MSYLANHDRLTDLANRFRFENVLKNTLEDASSKRATVAILFIDLDNFKTINDTLGHAAGDELLKEVALRLIHCLKNNSDSTQNDNCELARLGGDEFTVLLNNLPDKEAAETAAKRILIELKKPFILSTNIEIVVGASIGITLYPDHSIVLSQLLSNADMAMYAAKAKGKNNYCFFEALMDEQNQQQLSLESDLRQAIKKDQLSVHYQPLVNSSTHQIIGFEALLRWTHPTMGNISPEYFIPIAERSSLICDLGAWVLQQVIKQLQHWQSINPDYPLYCSVNISAVQLRHRSLFNDITKLLDEYKIAPHLLHLELTETALITEEEEASLIIDHLYQRGIDTWIDDFGTGYSSLSCLKKFNVQGVKVDRSFVADMENNDNSYSIVASVVAMAKSCEMISVAEGVETAQQVALLTSLGCELLQGFYLGEPISAAEITANLHNSPEYFSHQLLANSSSISALRLPQ